MSTRGRKPEDKVGIGARERDGDGEFPWTDNSGGDGMDDIRARLVDEGNGVGAGDTDERGDGAAVSGTSSN